MSDIHYCRDLGEWVAAAQRREIVTMTNGASGRLIYVNRNKGWAKVQFFTCHGRPWHGTVDLREILMVGDRIAKPWPGYRYVEPSQPRKRNDPMLASEYQRFSAIYEGRACEEPLQPVR